MPRARRPNAKTTARSGRPAAKAGTARKASSKTAAFVCPECGKTFSRAAALGSHRRTHGVAGSSAPAQTRSRRAGGSRATAARSTRKTATATKTEAARGRPAGAPVAGRARAARTANRRDQTVNRDALLQALFPNGIPARESVIRELNDWLDQGERLARRA